jgi:hypothetical protein
LYTSRGCGDYNEKDKWIFSSSPACHEKNRAQELFAAFHENIICFCAGEDHVLEYVSLLLFIYSLEMLIAAKRELPTSTFFTGQQK